MTKHSFFIFFLVGQLQNVTGQNNAESVNLPKPKGDPNCIYTSKYSEIQRSQFYPFNITDTIKLVSFRYHFENYPIKVDTVSIDSLIEVNSLTKSEVSKLTDILYNNFYKKRPNYGSLTQCFFPRNAVLFIDHSGQLKEYILICFHCNNHEESSDKIYFGEECSQKMEKLRLFFISEGIKFGTDKTVDLYPGEKYGDESIVPPIQ